MGRWMETRWYERGSHKYAINKTISFTNPHGKQYKLNNKTATLMVRPRGWHLIEKHVLVNGEPISASNFDFALYFFHNAHNQLYLIKASRSVLKILWKTIYVLSKKNRKTYKIIIKKISLKVIKPNLRSINKIKINLK